MEWKPFVYQQVVYDLCHLHPKTITYRQPEKANKPARRYSVDVDFGLHCFTRGIKENERLNRDLLYSDARETRVFDFRRYELSKLLPDIVDGLSELKCYHTGKGNFFTVTAIDDQGEEAEYEIFFAASRSTKKGTITLFVQSAYVRDAEHGRRPHFKPIRFLVILFNTLANRPIIVPQ